MVVRQRKSLSFQICFPLTPSGTGKESALSVPFFLARRRVLMPTSQQEPGSEGFVSRFSVTFLSQADKDKFERWFADQVNNWLHLAECRVECRKLP
jgi:hypothetical protein